MQNSRTSVNIAVDEVRLHGGVASINGVLGGRVEVVLQQLPRLVAYSYHVSQPHVDLCAVRRTTYNEFRRVPHRRSRRFTPPPDPPPARSTTTGNAVPSDLLLAGRTDAMRCVANVNVDLQCI